MENIEKIIGYEFKNKSLLQTALNHSSFANKNHIDSNERLEYLGDSIIGFLTADFLILNYNLKEGELSKIRSKIVSSANLSKIITNLKLDEYLKTFPQNLKTEAMKGDFFEALVGAVYLDSNFKICKEVVYKLLEINKENIDKISNENQDYKTMLQEYVQAKKGRLEYKLINNFGLANDLTFEIELFINGKSICKTKEKSKQKAENLCAKLAMEKVEKLFD